MEKPNINDVLSVITNDLVGRFDLVDLLNKIVDMVMRLLNAEVCSIFLDDKENNSETITMLAGSGFAKKLVNKAHYKVGEGFTGFIYQTGNKYNIKSPNELKSLKRKDSDEPIWAGKHDKEQWEEIGYKFKNLIVMPLKIREEIFGVIKVENKKEGINNKNDGFSNDDETIFEIITNVVSLAIENARLYQKFEKQMKSISAKAAHRINNQATNYDGIEYELGLESGKDICNHDNIKNIKERLRKTTIDLKSMIEEFRQFGKPLNINRKECNLNKIIEDEVWLAQQKEEKIRIDKNLDNELPILKIDEGRFAEAIKELIRNSVKAIGKTGRYDGVITLSTKYDVKNNQIEFRIEDNGAGFPKDFPVFEPFSTTDTQSTGLGLYTVRELVERHSGTIFKVDKSEGSCIQFILDITKN